MATFANIFDVIVGTQFDRTGLIQVLATLALLLPSLAVGVRRMHDVDRSGWWLLLLIIPVLGALTLMLAFFVRDSRPDNHYGPSPKAVGAEPHH